MVRLRAWLSPRYWRRRWCLRAGHPDVGPVVFWQRDMDGNLWEQRAYRCGIHDA